MGYLTGLAVMLSSLLAAGAGAHVLLRQNTRRQNEIPPRPLSEGV